MKILLAEDDAISRILMKKLLQQVSDVLIIAEDGAEAIRLFKENPDLDLILIDMRMPKMNGDEATLEIRKLNATIPIIAQTALTSTSEKQRILDVGCTDIIQKPIIKEILYEMISRYGTKK